MSNPTLSTPYGRELAAELLEYGVNDVGEMSLSEQESLLEDLKNIKESTAEDRAFMNEVEDILNEFISKHDK